MVWVACANKNPPPAAGMAANKPELKVCEPYQLYRPSTPKLQLLVNACSTPPPSVAPTSVLLSEACYPSNISPPAVVLGEGTMITTLDLIRLVLPLQTDVGPLEIQVVLKAVA